VATGVLLVSTLSVLTVLVPLRADRRATAVGLLTVMSRSIAILLFLELVYLTRVDPRFALWVAIAVGDLCLVLYVVLTEKRYFRTGKFQLCNPWAGSRWYSLSSLSVSAQQLDLPIIAACAGSAAAGIYGAVNRWTQPITLTINAFASASAPFLAAEGFRAMRKQIIRASWILLLAMMLCMAVIAIAPQLVVLLLGDGFADSATVLRWLAAGMILNSFVQPAIVALQARQYDRLAALILALSIGMQLTLVAVGAPQLGATSGGIAFAASQFFQFLCIITCYALIIRRRATVHNTQVDL